MKSWCELDKLGCLQDLLKNEYEDVELKMLENGTMAKIYINKAMYTDLHLQTDQLKDFMELEKMFKGIKEHISKLDLIHFKPVSFGISLLKIFITQNDLPLYVNFGMLYKFNSNLEIKIDYYKVEYRKSTTALQLTNKKNEEDQIIIKENGNVVFL